MILKIKDDGTIYFECSRCGESTLLDPLGAITCTKCASTEKIWSIQSFIDNYNKTLYVLVELPERLEKEFHNFLGLSMNDYTGSQVIGKIENIFNELVDTNYIKEWKTYRGSNGVLDCDFVMPTLPDRPITLTFGIT